MENDNSVCHRSLGPMIMKSGMYHRGFMQVIIYMNYTPGLTIILRQCHIWYPMCSNEDKS